MGYIDYQSLLMIMRDEGLSLEPYLCPAGVLTIGYGHSLTGDGLAVYHKITKNINVEKISLKNAYDLLLVDFVKIKTDLGKTDNFKKALPLSPHRVCVLYNMAFNLGVSGLMGFKKMWAALHAFDFRTAALEMLESKWALQVSHRAMGLSLMMHQNIPDHLAVVSNCNFELEKTKC